MADRPQFQYPGEAQGYATRMAQFQQELGRQKAEKEWYKEHPQAEEATPPVPNPNPVRRAAGYISQHSGTFRQTANVPKGIPRFLAQRQLLFMTWFLAMVLVSSSEWQQGFKFPRPARLWYTSLTYVVLFLVSQFDAMVPLCNALGGGFVVALGYEQVSGNSFKLFGVSLTGSSSGSSSSPGTGSVGSAASTGAAAGTLGAGVVSARQAQAANSATKG